jgi:HTH-type transcriptional regulator/antitoxin HigA
MITANLNQTVTAWSNLSDNLFVPHSEADYQKLVAILDNLLRYGEQINCQINLTKQ